MNFNTSTLIGPIGRTRDHVSGPPFCWPMRRSRRRCTERPCLHHPNDHLHRVQSVHERLIYIPLPHR